MLDETDALQGLTSKQYHFALHSFMGLDDADAYRKAYDAEGMQDETIGKAAHEVAQHPKVQAKLLELRIKSDRDASLAPLLTKDFVINGVMQLALTADKDSTRLRAYELLGKTVGIDLFRETHVVEKRERTLEEVDKELRERLKQLAPMIDAHANAPSGAGSTPTLPGDTARTIGGNSRNTANPAGVDRRRKPRRPPGPDNSE